MLISTSMRLNIGDNLDLSFTLPGYEHEDLLGRVVHVDTEFESEGQKKGRPRICEPGSCNLPQSQQLRLGAASVATPRRIPRRPNPTPNILWSFCILCI